MLFYELRDFNLPNVICTLVYLVVPGIFVFHPSVYGLSPIIDGERLGKLLTLSVAPTTLSLSPRDQMVLFQVDLQVFSDFAANLCFGAPGTAVLFLPNSETQWIVFVIQQYQKFTHAHWVIRVSPQKTAQHVDDTNMSLINN